MEGTNNTIRFILLSFIFAFFTIGIFLATQLFLQNATAGYFKINISKNNFPASLESSNVTTITQQAPVQQITQQIKPTIPKGLQLTAKSALSIEIENGNEKILFKKNEKQQLPIASLTKLMTTLVVLQQYDLNQEVIITEDSLKQEGEQGDLKVGQTLSVKDLLYITLIESSNRSAFALSEIISTEQFVILMNQTAKELGLTNTHFDDSTGLDAKSYSTAEDLVKLSKHLFENYPLFGEIIRLKEFELYLTDGSLHHTLINTNKLLGQVRGVVGGKTVWTQIARGSFMVIQKEQQNPNYFIHIILGSEERFEDMQNLMQWTIP